MDALREIIAGRNLTMLLITHNHKSSDADPLNKVYGSAGLTGAADGIFVIEKMKRSGDRARLTIANRDTEGFVFELRFDRSSCRWQFIGNAYSDSDEEDQLFELLDILLDDVQVWSGTATQLRTAFIALEPSFCMTAIGLSRMLKAHQDFLRMSMGIECRFTRTKSARLIELSRDVIVVDYENESTKPLGLAG
jgi:hypothetical protein